MIDYKSAHVDWKKGFSNVPGLDIVLFDAPTRSQMVWKQYGQHFIGKREDGLRAKLTHDGSERNNGGMGGRAQTLLMQDGTEKVLRGPWDCSTDVIEDEEGVCLVSVGVKGPRAGCYLGGYAITDEDFRQIVSDLGYETVSVPFSRLCPSLSADSVVKPD